MSSKSTAVAARKSTLPANWQEQMRADAAKGRQQVAKMGTSQRLKTQGGILMYMDTPVPGNAMDAIILATAPENSFYEGEFDPANTTPPVCYAFGTHETQIDSNGSGLAPHKDSPKPQAKTCGECNWNKFGTAEKGRGKACKNSVHVMLFHGDQLKKGLVGVKEAEVVSLSVPPTSGGSFKAWNKQMEDLADAPKYGFVTNIAVTPRQQGGHFVNLNAVKRVDGKLMAGVFQRAKDAEKEIDARPPYPTAEEADAKKPARGGAARQQQAPARQQQAKPARRKY